MLKLEELWSREEHREKLVAAIDEAEAAVLAQFRREALPENNEKTGSSGM